jgi:xanthine dehydrogenase iron-sulfur cluster and FAD-binding subunit A
MTDDEGRFTIRSVVRVDRVAVFHDVLNRTGIGSLSSAVDSTTRVRGVLTMATPSLATLWSRLCPEVVRQRGREGIVFGGAVAANGSTRVAGVRMRVS